MHKPAETVNEEYIESPCDGIAAIIQSRERDLGSFSVRRFLPHNNCRKVGPFVFFDHMGPAQFSRGQGLDVRPHPHIGLATVTYLYEGEIVHRDSLGCVQSITPGAVNWMTAGKGIVHSERTGDVARASGQRMHGLQVWVALPEEYEETGPEFHHYEPGDLPVVSLDNVTMTIIAGSLFASESPVRTFSPLFYVDVDMPAATTLQIPDDYAERAVHVIAGEVDINGRNVQPFNMVICREAESIRITAVQQSRLVIFGGAPITDRYLWWNFVSSSRARIEQAKQDWQQGRFDPVPGETESIPLPER